MAVATQNTQEGRKPETVQQTEARKARQRKRSIVMALALFALVVMFYLLTIVKMGPGLFVRVL